METTGTDLGHKTLAPLGGERWSFRLTQAYLYSKPGAYSGIPGSEIGTLSCLAYQRVWE